MSEHHHKAGAMVPGRVGAGVVWGRLRRPWWGWHPAPDLWQNRNENPTRATSEPHQGNIGNPPGDIGNPPGRRKRPHPSSTPLPPLRAIL
ncbi:MAG TPA: hypothetical protein VF844_14465 [Ktedonobacteraceae bacterium]